MTEIPFVKYHGAGNDFIVVAADDLGLKEPGDGAPRRRWLAAFARSFLDRHTGVGADGLFVVWTIKGSRSSAAVRIFNVDGGEAEISGNGLRCAAAWLMDRGATGTRLSFVTAAGPKEVQYLGSRRGERFFRVSMGEPVLEPASVPFRTRGVPAPVARYALATSLGPRGVTVTSMGNPHCTIFVTSFGAFDWRALGREIERHRAFPNRTNVEFVRVLSTRAIEVRFWERGVGETASSGTGSSAAVVAAILNGRTGRDVVVRTPGGILKVQWSSSNEVFLTGPVRRVAAGSYEFDTRERREPS
ncbi:MAG TPA: diaminopimelate epimerase [Terriglobia bacterium]|nr:diaminopimelate epimerase [Terriglobia bacterium]